MKVFLVFKTSVKSEHDVASLAPVLNEIVDQWNFDLQDCDKILRVEESGNSNNSLIESSLKAKGFLCEELL